MILQDKTAVIYGAGGSLGSSFAKAFAAAGAHVFLTGRNKDSLQKVADAIHAAGGKATIAIVDAFDQQAITHQIDDILRTEKHLDISFNAVGIDLIQNIPLTDMDPGNFVRHITQTMQTRFLTAIAATKAMMPQGSGVILSLTATPGGIGYPYTTAFAPACAAVESFSRNLAAEAGIYGIRVVNIRSGGSPDSKVFKDAMEAHPDAMKITLKQMEGDTMLKQLPLMAHIANTAVFLASDAAASITGVTIDVTAGTTAGLNYRVEKTQPPRQGTSLTQV